MTITFRVDGIPVQQGNHRQNQYGATYETSKNHKPWRDSVIWHAREARLFTATEYIPEMTGPVNVDLIFWFLRPKSHYGTGKNADVLKPDAPHYKTSAPDIDKLTRSVLDALAIAGVYKSDAQVAALNVSKCYVNDYHPTPGMLATVEAA